MADIIRGGKMQLQSAGGNRELAILREKAYIAAGDDHPGMLIAQEQPLGRQDISLDKAAFDIGVAGAF